MKKIFVINGPNLNMLGIREKEIYGEMSLEKINEMIKKKADELNLEVEFFQSNIEGEIVDAIHSAYGKMDGIIINPGAYSHYSLAIYDALKAVSINSIEVHISNVFKRENMRENLVTAKASKALISGFGAYSYILALEGLLNEE
ncbi:MAG: type II 3-dehydroquinate dehydratase [Clostridia bacterium]|nr:type II 3-dehydroquinate dehydratase [Clostridia bacterium]